MSEDAPEPWWEAKGTSSMVAARENEEEAKAETPGTPFRSPETYSLSQEQQGKDQPPQFNYFPLGPSDNMWEFWEM